MEIIVDNVTKYIKNALILEKVSLELCSGMIYGLQGPNGSGKTMLMRMVAGLIRPSSGTVTIDGRKLGIDMDFPPSVGMLIEGPAFLPEYTGFQNLKLLAQIQGRVGKDEICTAMSNVGLIPEDKRKYRKYSLGMKQRLGIAAAIMEHPDLLILDEPTNALDDYGINQICQLIRNERDRGALVIMSCHDALILEDLADEVFSVSAGRIKKKVNE